MIGTKLMTFAGIVLVLNVVWKVWLSTFLSNYLKNNIMFMVNDGNEDKEDLKYPEKYGLENTQNVYWGSLDNRVYSDRLGAWFISQKDYSLFNARFLSAEDTVFILLHGNAKNRGASHRIAAYKIFQSLGYHTLTVDYRGYGDSIMSFSLNETTVVEDAMASIKLVRDSVGSKAKLIIYGHSMGTGISAHAVVKAMENQNKFGRVDGIIIDSPFHSMGVALRLESTIGYYLNYLLDIQGYFQDTVGLWFDNPKWLSQLNIPVRVFHAVSDNVTPLSGAQRLVEDVKKTGKENIDLVIWEEEGLGHIGISKTKTFPDEIKRFTDMVHQL